MIVRLSSYEPNGRKRHFLFGQHATIGNYVSSKIGNSNVAGERVIRVLHFVINLEKAHNTRPITTSEVMLGSAVLSVRRNGAEMMSRCE